jgi:hypothetical protein
MPRSGLRRPELNPGLCELRTMPRVPEPSDDVTVYLVRLIDSLKPDFEKRPAAPSVRRGLADNWITSPGITADSPISEKVEAYLERAVELEELAAKTPEPDRRRSYIDVAQRYRRLVEFMLSSEQPRSRARSRASFGW